MAFVSASQDVVIDAYRTDLLTAAERGLGSSLNVLGYRLAMIVSGGVALIWTDPSQGGGWTWTRGLPHDGVADGRRRGCSRCWRCRAWRRSTAAARRARNDVIGFIAVLAAVALGYLLTRRMRRRRSRACCWRRWLSRSTLSAGIAGALGRPG